MCAHDSWWNLKDSEGSCSSRHSASAGPTTYSPSPICKCCTLLRLRRDVNRMKGVFPLMIHERGATTFEILLLIYYANIQIPDQCWSVLLNRYPLLPQAWYFSISTVKMKITKKFKWQRKIAAIDKVLILKRKCQVLTEEISHVSSAWTQWAGKSWEGIFHVMFPIICSFIGSSVKLYVKFIVTSAFSGDIENSACMHL